MVAALCRAVTSFSEMVSFCKFVDKNIFYAFQCLILLVFVSTKAGQLLKADKYPFVIILRYAGIFLHALVSSGGIRFSFATFVSSHSEVDLQSLISRPASTLSLPPSPLTLTAANADVVVSAAAAAITRRRRRRNTFDVSNQNTEKEHRKSQGEWEDSLECPRRKGHFAHALRPPPQSRL